MPTPMPPMPDNQAPIIPPTAKLTSSQKIQLAKVAVKRAILKAGGAA